MRFARAALGLAAASTLAASIAHASPDDLVGRPLVLDDGGVELRLTIEMGIQQRQRARPLSFAPDAWWGASRHWTIGVIHSARSVDQIDAGGSLCVRDSSPSLCSGRYRGSGFDVRYGARSGSVAIAPRVRLLLRDIDPAKPAITLGSLMRWQRGRFAIQGDPYLRLPLGNGDRGNRSAIVIPLWLAVQPARGWLFALRSGFDADLAVVGDGWHGPLSLAVTTRITRAVELAIEAGWPRLLGPQYDAKQGAVHVALGWRR